MMAKTEKISFISTARVIGILLVVFGHSYPFDVYLPPFFWKMQEWIYLYHMPLFIFISGFLLAKTRKTAGTYIGNRAVKLLVPYLALSLAAFVPKVLVQNLLNDSAELSLGYLLRTELIPRQNVWGHFWYIPVVFFLGCGGILMLRHMRGSKAVRFAALAVTVALLFLPKTTDWLALEDLRKTAFYFTLGMAVSLMPKWSDALRHPAWLLALPGSIILLKLADNTAAGILAACGMIGCVCFIGSRWEVEGWLKTVEENSFSIFLLSWPVQAVAEVLLNKVLHLPALLVMACMFLSGVIGPMICVKILTAIDKKISIGWIKTIAGM